MEWSQELELDLGSGQGVESKQEPFLELEPNANPNQEYYKEIQHEIESKEEEKEEEEEKLG
jgi:hypothetical protein